MRSVIIAVLLWGTVAFQLYGLRRRKDHNVLWFALSLTAALTITIDPFYVALDGLLGGRNLLHLISNLLMAVSMFCLSRAILSGIQRASTGGRIGALVALALSMTISTVFFFLTDAPVSSTAYMLDYGSQFAATVHASGLFLYVGAVMGFTCWSILRALKAMTTSATRAGLLLTALGCLSVVALCAVVMAMNTAHVLGRLDIVRAFIPVYDPLYLSSFILLFAGLSIPPIVRRAAGRRREKRTNAMAVELQPMWERLVGTEGTIPQSLPDGTDATRRLHRRITEIRDALLRTAETPSKDERLLLEDAERHLTVTRV